MVNSQRIFILQVMGPPVDSVQLVYDSHFTLVYDTQIAIVFIGFISQQTQRLGGPHPAMVMVPACGTKKCPANWDVLFEYQIIHKSAPTTPMCLGYAVFVLFVSLFLCLTFGNTAMIYSKMSRSYGPSQNGI